MLAAVNRLTSGPAFAEAIRKGKRSGAGTLVVHLQLPEPTGSSAVRLERPAKVGFVVSKQVGNAVVRTQVKRRLRHLMRERLAVLAPGAVLVVRAQPSAAQAGSHRLGADLDRALARVHGVQGA